MGGMLTPEQKLKFEQLKAQLPADLTPGYSVSSTGTVDPRSSFVKGMSRFARDMDLNAAAYFNFTATGKGALPQRKRKPQRILSPEGFPPWVSVTYAYPPPFAFKTPMNIRDVKHFVFHSFGHAWHATSNGNGWMNSTRQQRGVTPIEFEDRTVFIPKGSDAESFAHFTRFSAGLRACLGSAAKASAHFFIDRAGNLLVVGDCNDILFTSQGLNGTSLGVEIEEAFYVLKDTKGKGNKAKWRPGGNPAGTAGNIEYFAYSPQQMLTLSVLCKKLELVYPRLKERNIQFVRQGLGPDGPPGYTMHDFIRGSKHLDVSPHFLQQPLWDAFFALVDSHEHLNPTNVFRPRQKWTDGGQSFLAKPVAESAVTAMTSKMLEYAKNHGLAADRSAQMANLPRKAGNNIAAIHSVEKSEQIEGQAAVTTQIMQQTQSCPLDLPAIAQAVGVTGSQEGSDDWW
jgi:hypothetical protein